MFPYAKGILKTEGNRAVADSATLSTLGSGWPRPFCLALTRATPSYPPFAFRAVRPGRFSRAVDGPLVIPILRMEKVQPDSPMESVLCVAFGLIRVLKATGPASWILRTGEHCAR